MSSISSMLPMLLVLGLAVVAFMKRCEFLPELCNPSQQQQAAQTAPTATGPAWDDYVKASKEAKKDADRDEETLRVADRITSINANRKQYASVSGPSITNSGQNRTSLPAGEKLSIPGLWGARAATSSGFARVAYF